MNELKAEITELKKEVASLKSEVTSLNKTLKSAEEVASQAIGTSEGRENNFVTESRLQNLETKVNSYAALLEQTSSAENINSQPNDY